MGRPGVNIEIENGALGLVAGTDDGVAGLILSGVAVGGQIGLSDPKQIFSTDEAKALGLDAAYDTANSTNVWKNIKDFYAQAGEGAALWVMLYDPTTLMASVADKANDLATKLLDAADGKIRLVALGRVPDGGYVPTYDDEVDDDVTAAILKLHETAEEYASQFKPFRAIIDGRDYQGTIGDLIDLTGNTNNRVQVAISTDVAGSKNAAIGLLLGRYAANPVQRNPGRVKDGDVGVTASYLTDGTTTIESMSSGEQDQLHDKGFVFLRRWQGRNGYYFNDDPMACPASDDYSSFARGRVIDKALTITYDTYVNEILDDLDVDDDGFMAPVVAKDYQAKIQNALDLNMTANGEVSAITATVDPKQNVLSTNKVKVSLKIRPKFYSKTIEVTLGFENPALA
ncbi:DUF2586 family protein [Reichenbachiella sp.]|uniref:DUF2586 family protein n=1 Tax=Reichenbachiella sp. TaxID=2184521 RepID=UPI003B5C9337